MIYLHYDGQAVIVKSTAYNLPLIKRLKSVSAPTWDKARKSWRINAYDATNGLRIMLQGFDEVKTTQEFDNAEPTFAELKKRLDKNVVPEIPFTPAVKLWPHQLVMLHHMLKLPFFANFSEVGTGKTYPTIIYADYRKKTENIKILVISPLTIIDKWCDEYKQITGRELTPLLGTPNKRTDKLNKYNECIINYEGSRIIKEGLKNKHFDLVICDESHRVKNPKAEQSKAIAEIVLCSKYRIIMTGTNITNTAMDLFMQIFILNPAVFGESFYAWRGKYFRNENMLQPNKEFYTCKICGYKNDVFSVKQKHAERNTSKVIQCDKCRASMKIYLKQDYPVWTIKPGAIEQLNEHIFSTGIRYTKAECLDLPPNIFETRLIKMTVEQERAYNQMLEKMIISFSLDEKVTANFVLTQLLRLQTITSGWVKTDNDTIAFFKTNPKFEELKYIIDELFDEQIVIWAHFRNDLNYLNKNIPKSSVISGDVDIKERIQRLKDFKEGKIRILICQPGVAGEGINLTNASYSIRFSRSHSLKDFEQSIGRLHRFGATKKVTNFDMVMKGTYDEIIYRNIMKKQNLFEKINIDFIKMLKFKREKQ